MIRLGQLVEIDDIHKDTFNKLEVRNEIENIEAHCQKVKEKLET